MHIVFENVFKNFYLQHQKTLKEALQAVFSKQKPVGVVRALKDVSFKIRKGESVGIIGRNGAGKSTILKLIAGVSNPTRGRVVVEGRVSPLIELGAGFHPDLTGYENAVLNAVILGLTREEAKRKLKDIVGFSELKEKFLHMPIKYYSSGMYMRLAFSSAVMVEPEILLVDEILAVGDAGFQKKCRDKMFEFKKKGITIIYVSHNVEEIKNFCDRVIYLKNGAVVYDGDVDKGVLLYKKELV